MDKLRIFLNLRYLGIDVDLQYWERTKCTVSNSNFYIKSDDKLNLEIADSFYLSFGMVGCAFQV